MATAASYISKQDQLEVSTYTWPTSVDPAVGVVQIAHGLAEHGSRYARFATALNDAGFHVVASDHRGHGATITETPEISVRSGSQPCGRTSSSSANSF